MTWRQIQQAQHVFLAGCASARDSPDCPHGTRVLLLLGGCVCPEGLQVVDGLDLLVDDGPPQAVQVRSLRVAGGRASGGVGQGRRGSAAGRGLVAGTRGDVRGGAGDVAAVRRTGVFQSELSQIFQRRG